MVFMDMCSLLIMPSVTWYEQSNLVSVSLFYFFYFFLTVTGGEENSPPEFHYIDNGVGPIMAHNTGEVTTRV